MISSPLRRLLACVHAFVLYLETHYRPQWGGVLVWVDEEAGEGAVLVGIASVHFAPVELDTHLIAYVQMQDHAVGSIVVILISVLSDGTGSYLPVLL